MVALTYCEWCRCNVRYPNWEEHICGRRHQREVRLNRAAPSTSSSSSALSESSSNGGAADVVRLRKCDVCRCIVRGRLCQWEQHIAGRKHLREVRRLDDDSSDSRCDSDEDTEEGGSTNGVDSVNDEWDGTYSRYCETCNCVVGGGSECWSIHVNGRRHRSGGKVFTRLECEVCDCCVMCWHSNSWEEHVRGRRHRSLDAYSQQCDGESQNQRSDGVVGVGVLVVVTAEQQQSQLEETVRRCDSAMKAYVGNNPWPGNYFVVVDTRVSLQQSTLLQNFALDMVLSQNRFRTLAGPFQRASEAFRSVTGVLRGLKILDGFITSTPSSCGFKDEARGRSSSRFAEFASSGRKPHQAPMAFVHPLKPYAIPSEILDRAGASKLGSIIQSVPLREASQKYAKNLLGPAGSAFQLTADNFKVALHTLLYIEEAEITNALHRYDIDGAKLLPVRDLFELTVDGLAEKRPSVLRGDTIRAIDGSGRTHMGYAHHVNVDNVHVSFDSRSVSPLSSYLVQFMVKRSDFRILHRAIDENKTFLDLKWALTPPVERGSSTVWRGGTLNYEQSQFVSFALNPACRLNILWGPPGTGKTTTLVRYLRTLLPNQRGKVRKVVVCTPSNAASDYLTQRLGQITTCSILRVVALTRQHGDLPADIRKFAIPASPGENELRMGHRLPDDNEVGKADVIVITLGTAGRLFGAHPTLRCSHLIVDEAGQATEADLNLGLAFCDENTEHVVLAGDPKQLGPVTQSGIAKRYGFNRSPLQRLLEDEEIRKNTSKMLKINYRSHPSILSVVNLHYDGVLVSPENLSLGKFTNVDVLPGNTPDVRQRIRLIHHEGVESQEADSPSIMNNTEVIKVLVLINELLGSGEAPSSIVVLTPYLKQAQKIRRRIFGTIPGIEPKSIEVCTIEAFQGRESKNIIISCVRSVATDDMIRADIKRHLGFLKQPQRTNVAISRAIDRLWVVGNWNLLRRDLVWAKLLFHVITVLNIRVESMFGYGRFRWDEATPGATFNDAFEAADGPRDEERGDDAEGGIHRLE